MKRDDDYLVGSSLRAHILGTATDAVIDAYKYHRSYSACESLIYRLVSGATEQAFPVGNMKPLADAVKSLLEAREDHEA